MKIRKNNFVILRPLSIFESDHNIALAKYFHVE